MLTGLINLIEPPSLDSIDECQRLFHGRGRVFEGFNFINVDWFSPVVFIVLYQQVDEVGLSSFAQTLMQKIPACESVKVQHRYLPRARIDLLAGKEVERLEASEHGLKYFIEFGAAQNLGLFLDMSNGRKWVMQHAKHKKILNLFSFTCGFSVAGLAGGASQVVNIDNNNGVLKRGKDNHRLNDLDMRAASFEKLDIFKSFGRIKKYGPYDMLICDPPTFQQGSVDIRRDYGKIIRRIPQWISPQGQVVLCLNSPDLTDTFLFDAIDEHCPECKLESKINPPDIFKEAEEGRGLKVLVFRYKPDMDVSH